jgi:hypothetical protein
VNEALARKTEAARLQAEASDQWAYYQAKNLKAMVTGATRSIYLALDKTPPEELAANLQRYAEDQRRASEKAKALEHERDTRDAEADRLMHHHHRYAQAVALLQVAIALGAVAALTRRRAVWFGSIALGAVGGLVLGWTALAG